MSARILLTFPFFLSAGCGPEEHPMTNQTRDNGRPSTAFVDGGAGRLGLCPIGIKLITREFARVATAGEGRPETDQVVAEGDLLVACGSLYRVARVAFDAGAGGAVGGGRSSVWIENDPVTDAGVSIQPDSLVLTQRGKLRLGPGKSSLEELTVEAEGPGDRASLVIATGPSRQSIDVRAGEAFGVDDRRLRVRQIVRPDRVRGVTGWVELEWL
jgi:hypothetical protein